MKRPEELAAKLAGQWHNGALRERRLLDSSAWPLKLPIGKPPAKTITGQPEKVMAHVKRWRSVLVGQVQWDEIQYRSTSDPVAVPTHWVIADASEWVAATRDRNVSIEYTKLKSVLDETETLFHSLLVRQRHLILSHSSAELIQATKLALLLEQGCAAGVPLRALSLAGIDSKFFERHRSLIIRLLNLRFNGLPGELGLEAFLDAASEGSHWLLVADLDGKLLPFERMRVRDSELRKTPLPGSRVLIVENERCLHNLPVLKDTVAILGAGLNLAWMQATWLHQRHIGYWGDIDTWGLTMLAHGREHQPALHALLMTKEIFACYRNRYAVVEQTPANDAPLSGLDTAERALYGALLEAGKGRLEQEFLPREIVHREILAWHK